MGLSPLDSEKIFRVAGPRPFSLSRPSPFPPSPAVRPVCWQTPCSPTPEKSRALPSCSPPRKRARVWSSIPCSPPRFFVWSSPRPRSIRRAPLAAPSAPAFSCCLHHPRPTRGSPALLPARLPGSRPSRDRSILGRHDSSIVCRSAALAPTRLSRVFRGPLPPARPPRYLP